MIGEFSYLCKLEIITSVIELNPAHGVTGKPWWNSNKLQYVVIDLGTISLDESGYYRINDNEKYPIYTKIVEISYYSLITPISAINIYRGENGGAYVFGSPNTEIQGLQIRCWYWQ